MRLLKRVVAATFVAMLGAGCSAPREPETHPTASSILARSGGFVLEALNSGTSASLRGLSVVNDRVVWASGANGTVLRTVDGGDTWITHRVAGADSLDFRDIHAFDDRVAIAMATAGRLFRTTDGGASWTQVYASRDTSAFLDAISFWDATHGIVLGDPLGGAFLILLTDDGGATWRELPNDSSPRALPGEAAFAASGSALAVAGTRHAWFGTGGASVARVFRSADRGRSWSATTTPVAAGSSSAGIFSVVFSDTLGGVIAGGDYRRPASATANLAHSTDGGRTFTLWSPSPPQYLSSMAIHPPPRILTMAAGIAGIVYASHDTTGWSTLHSGEWNTIAFGDERGWIVGPSGRIARLTF